VLRTIDIASIALVVLCVSVISKAIIVELHLSQDTSQASPFTNITGTWPKSP